MKLKNLNNNFVDEVAKIEKESFKNLGWSKKNIAKEINNNDCVFKVLIDDEKVIGYYSYYKVLDEAYINNIAVKKEFQNKGYGKMLVLDVIETAKKLDIKKITLEVRVSNVNAIKLYENLNFKFFGIRPKFYENTEDAKIYWLNLEG